MVRQTVKFYIKNMQNNDFTLIFNGPINEHIEVVRTLKTGSSL